MWQFIISGYVPGTELQITFDMFATFSCVFLAILILWEILRWQLNVRRELAEIMARVAAQNTETLSEISI